MSQALVIGPLALLAARLGFVWEFRTVYLAAPLEIVNIRDGGWSPTAGLVVAWLYALGRIGATPSLRRPLQGALLTASVLWLAGAVVLAMRPGPGPAMPDLALVALDGRTVDMAQFSGKPVVVNLWATWCPPCVREMPVLQRAQAEYPEVHFVFVNQAEPRARVADLLHARNMGLGHVLLDDAGRFGAAVGQRALPTTLFFDARGLLAGQRVGELSPATLRQHLQALQP